MTIPTHAPVHMAGLNGIRALAVIAVVWHHTHPGFPGLPATLNGFLGVDLFFVLSGFLITKLLLIEQATTGDISLRNFYVRRSLRIFPLYYAVLALLTVYFCFAPGTSGSRVAYFEDLPYHLTYTSNWIASKTLMSVTWSLSTEEQFYLLWPPLLVWFGLRSRAALVALLVAFLAFNQAINFGFLDLQLADWGIPYASLSILQTTFSPIVLGVLLAFALQARAMRPGFERITGHIGFPVAVVVMLLAANTAGDIRGWPRLIFQLSSAWVLAAVVLRPQHVIVRALEWRPFAYVGTISYGVYLLHMLVVSALNRTSVLQLLPSPEAFFVLVLSLTVFAASLSFAFFEKPLLRLKDAFR